MTDRDREAFEAWLTDQRHWPADKYKEGDYRHPASAAAFIGWQAALAHAREAGAQEPVAAPARDKMVADLISIADASRRGDGSDIPLGETLRKAAAMLAAAPVPPAADSGEDDSLPLLPLKERVIGTISSHTPAPQPGEHVSDPYKLDTAAPQLGGVVKVKALKWRRSKMGAYMGAYTGCKAFYEVKVGPGQDEKMAAADAEHERAILAALEPSPSQWNAGAEEWEKAARRTRNAIVNLVENYHYWHGSNDLADARTLDWLAKEIRLMPLPTPAGE